VQIPISNPNKEPITLAPAETTGDPAFVVSRDCGPLAMPSKGTCAVVVTFDPTRIGRYGGTLVVSDTDGRTSSVDLVGTGFAELTISTKGSGTVTVDSGGTSTRCGQECEPIEISDSVTLTADPDCSTADCSFVRWAGPGCPNDSTATCRPKLTENVTVTARFKSAPTASPSTTSPVE
jgi:hypothetical protein